MSGNSFWLLKWEPDYQAASELKSTVAADESKLATDKAQVATAEAKAGSAADALDTANRNFDAGRTKGGR